MTDKIREAQARVPGTVTSFLADRGRNRDSMRMEEDGTIWYPVDTLMHQDLPESKLAEYVERLPQIVPGLEVVRSAREPNPWSRGAFKSFIWFTWSEEAMRARYEDTVARHGVADPRLDYMTCSGKRKGTFQLELDGMPVPEPVAKGGWPVYASWTALGLGMMEEGFCCRICDPNQGGPRCIPFDQRVEYQDRWWLVGSRGDGLEVMELEIQGSPLAPHVKDNLLLNLRNYRKAA